MEMGHGAQDSIVQCHVQEDEGSYIRLGVGYSTSTINTIDE